MPRSERKLRASVTTAAGCTTEVPHSVRKVPHSARKVPHSARKVTHSATNVTHGPRKVLLSAASYIHFLVHVTPEHFESCLLPENSTSSRFFSYLFAYHLA